jgi:hypothetical protein
MLQKKIAFFVYLHYFCGMSFNMLLRETTMTLEQIMQLDHRVDDQQTSA